MHTAVVITGGGAGKRFGGETPKQFISLPLRTAERPILAWTAGRFNRHPLVGEIIITVPLKYVNSVKKMVKKYRLTKVTAVVAGGVTRNDSVLNALWMLTHNPPDYVLIHDAVRPFVGSALLDRLIKALKKFRAVIPVVHPRDTVRRRGKRGAMGELEDRDSLFLVQTPQAFRWDVIVKSLPLWSNTGKATDDATIVARQGVRVGLTEGSPVNIKITTKDDLFLARAIARRWKD